MNDATTILVIAALVNLFVGALSGIPMGLARQAGADESPKYLAALHMAGLMQAPVLLGVGWAMTFSEMSNGYDIAAALVFAAASILLLVKDFINWRQGVRDEFAENTVGLKIGNVFGPVHMLGLVLVTIAIVSGF